MANKNKIRFARSITRNNLPAVLEYGEPGYVKNDRLIIGNEDGTEFIVNDWNTLKNKPDITGLETSIAFTTDELIQSHRVVRIKPSNGRIVRASKNSLSTARVIGMVTDEAIAETTALVQSTGVVSDSTWSWTPGDAIYLGNTVGGLTNDISGFSETDARCLVGIAISPTEILLTIQPPQLATQSSGGGDPAELPIVQTVAESDTENVSSSGAVFSHVAGAIAGIDLPPDLTTEVGDLENRMDDAEERLDDAEEDITNLSTDVSTLIADLGTTMTQVNTNTSNITNIANVVNGQIVQTLTEDDTTHAPSSDAVIKYVAANIFPHYSATGREAGKFYTGTDTPVSSNRLNFDGNLHVNDLHTNESSIYIGGNRVSAEGGTLKFQPDQQSTQYELVGTELGAGGVNTTGIKGKVDLFDGDLTFNKDQLGLGTVPSRNVNMMVERGAENNVGIRWNEVSDVWEATTDGSTYRPFVFLNTQGKVSPDLLPETVVGALNYRGTWNASAGTYPPNPEKGFFWVISTAGYINDVDYQVGDWTVFNGNWWDKVDNTDRVNSVAGRTGNITLTSADVGLENVINARAIQAPASSTPNRLVQWDGLNGGTVKTAPATVSDTAELTLHSHQAKITVDRTGIGPNQSLSWNEGNRSFISSAPFYAPNLPQVFQSNGFLTADKPQFLLVHQAQSVTFDITISNQFATAVRSERVHTVLGSNNLAWSSSTLARIGNTNPVTVTVSQNETTTVLGFEVKSGSWSVVVHVTPLPFWNGVPISYSMGI